ncbi:MAG: hypothetical protein CMA72_04395 [Euryarchaeota archaeon]|nr:hypothetical protein [Euryarchaeota archaeon]|tara:strand:- start:7880 stop:8068 length:189 start_codon:yes stop_codon:yes gene_type:complete
MLEANTEIIVDNGHDEKYRAEVLKLMRWTLNEDVYLIRITQGSNFGCITHARESWLTPTENE